MDIWIYEMLNFYKKLTKDRRTGRPPRNIDPAMNFTPREWADLPPHHPRTNRA